MIDIPLPWSLKVGSLEFLIHKFSNTVRLGLLLFSNLSTQLLTVCFLLLAGSWEAKPERGVNCRYNGSHITCKCIKLTC